MLHDILSVATGAAVGGSIRHHLTRGTISPRGSLVRVCAINVSGSFFLGLTSSLHRNKLITKRVSLALGTGFCGGFTTFSTFAAQIVDTIGSGGRGLAGAYIAVSCTFGIMGMILGRLAGDRFVM